MFSNIFKRFCNFGIFFSLYGKEIIQNVVNFVMWKCLNLVVLHLTLRLCPVHPVHVNCFLQTVSILVGSQILMKE